MPRCDKPSLPASPAVTALLVHEPRGRGMKEFAQHGSQTLTELLSEADTDSGLPSLNIRQHASSITTYEIHTTVHRAMHVTVHQNTSNRKRGDISCQSQYLHACKWGARSVHQ